MLTRDNDVIITDAAKKGRLRESLGAPSVNLVGVAISVVGTGTWRRSLGRVLLVLPHQCSSTLSVYACACV